MASYSSSGVQVSWNDSLLPGMGGVSAPTPVAVVSLTSRLFVAPVAVSPAPRLLVASVAVAVAVLPWCAMVSRVAFTPGFPVSGASARRAWVSLWAWRAVSSSVST